MVIQYTGFQFNWIRWDTLNTKSVKERQRDRIKSKIKFHLLSDKQCVNCSATSGMIINFNLLSCCVFFVYRKSLACSRQSQWYNDHLTSVESQFLIVIIFIANALKSSSYSKYFAIDWIERKRLCMCVWRADGCNITCDHADSYPQCEILQRSTSSPKKYKHRATIIRNGIQTGW